MDAAAAVARIADEIGQRGFAIYPEFLEEREMLEVRDEARSKWDAGDFRPAGTGRGAEHALRPELRSDCVLWIDEAAATAAQRVYLERLELLRVELNRTLFLGLLDFEGHLAVYPPAAFYRKHRDRFRDTDRRVLSTVLYLNHHWGDEDGGELRLFLDPSGEGGFIDVPPRGGTLVAFLSGQFWHEVLPSRAERMSWTGWFRRRV